MKALLPRSTREGPRHGSGVAAAPAVPGCVGAGGGVASCARPLRAEGPRRGRAVAAALFLPPPPVALLRAAPRKEAGRGSEGGCGRAAAPSWWPPSPSVQPGRSPSHGLLSQLDQASGKLGQVPRAGAGSPLPIPWAQAVPTAPPLPAAQAAGILPSSFHGIPGLQAVPAVAPWPPGATDGDGTGHVLRSSRASQDVSCIPGLGWRHLPALSGNGQLWGSRSPAPLSPLRGASRAAPRHLGTPCLSPSSGEQPWRRPPAPSPLPPRSRDLLSKSRKK